MMSNQHKSKIFYEFNRNISAQCDKRIEAKKVDQKKGKQTKSKQSQLNSMYNQDISPQDSEVTSFYYHKTLAFECFLAVFSLASIILSLINFYKTQQIQEILIRKSFTLIVVFTILGSFTIILQKITKSKWSIAKKQKKFSKIKQAFSLILKIIIFAPCPMQYFIGITVWMPTNTDQTEIQLNLLLCFYMVVVRSYYVVIFLIHSQLFYGSRPDRLSRLYTVDFGTINAVRFIINQKPGLFSITAFCYNFLIFPLCLLIIQGSFNQNLNNFNSCLHFVVITQVTVGYGDIYVVSSLGKIVTYVVMMVGAIFTSFLLILFQRIVKLQTNQQQARILLKSLQLKQQIQQNVVFRIESQWVFANSRIRPEQRLKKLNQLKAFRYQNKKTKNDKQVQLMNFKKLMSHSFAQINRMLKVIKEKNYLISQCISALKKSLKTDPNINHSKFYEQNKENQKLNKQMSEKSLIKRKKQENKTKISQKSNVNQGDIFTFDELDSKKVIPNKNILQEANNLISKMQQKIHGEHINKKYIQINKSKN